MRDGTLTDADHAIAVEAFDYDITHRYNHLDIMPVMIYLARRLAIRHPLRAYDAVQLATAWLLNQDFLSSGSVALTLICADERLNTIARAEGLLTDNPNHHS